MNFQVSCSQMTAGLIKAFSSFRPIVQMSSLTEHMKQCKGQFQLILEGEKEVDACRNGLITCEQNEEKLKKELQRAQKKGTAEEVLLISKKLEQAVQARARAEYNSKCSDLCFTLTVVHDLGFCS